MSPSNLKLPHWLSMLSREQARMTKSSPVDSANSDTLAQEHLSSSTVRSFTFLAYHFHTESSGKYSNMVLLWHFAILRILGHGRVERVVAVCICPVSTITNEATNGGTNCLPGENHNKQMVREVFCILVDTHLCELRPYFPRR